MPQHSRKPSAARSAAPGLVLTFDDSANIPNWVEQIPLFSRYGVFATFFVEAVDLLTVTQWEGIHKLIAAGHEIGCHGLRHLKAVEAISSMGVSSYIDAEIAPANTRLREAGIEPTSFAYPCSQNDAGSDAALAQFFRHARTGSDVPSGLSLAECDQFFTGLDDRAGQFCFVGKGIDRFTTECVDRVLVPALRRVNEKQEMIVLYSHNISWDDATHFVTPATIELLLQRASELGVDVGRLCDVSVEQSRV